MSTTPRVLQAETATLAVNRKDSLRASVATAGSILAGLPGVASLTITRGPWFCPAMLLLIWVALLSLLAGTLLVARGGSSPEVQQQFLAWERACVLGVESEDTVHEVGAGNSSYYGAAPGLGKYEADGELNTTQAITLADVVLAIGQPQWGCLDYGLYRGEATIWLRVVFDDGQIEAFAPLAATMARLTPDTSMYVFYCYASGADYPVWKVGPWHGFVPLDAYWDCRHTGTVTPPKGTP